MRLYIDTSVIGGYFEKEFETESKKLIGSILQGEHLAVISDLTLTELEKAPLQVRELTDLMIASNAEYVAANREAEQLAEKYLLEKIVTHKFRSDALHIAMATLHKVDVVISWNFKHIVNLNRIRLYNSVNLKYGYGMIEIRSPKEIVE